MTFRLKLGTGRMMDSFVTVKRSSRFDTTRGLGRCWVIKSDAIKRIWSAAWERHKVQQGRSGRLPLCWLRALRGELRRRLRKSRLQRQFRREIRAIRSAWSSMRVGACSNRGRDAEEN